MSAGGYVAAIKSMEVSILAAADLGSYQGDWVGLVKDQGYVDKEFGFVVIGYGSCSGCDAWEAADSAADRAQIVATILNAARWFDTIEEAKACIAGAAEANLGYFVHEDGWPAFVEAAQAANEWTEATS